jgi:hypothetical protein
MGIEADLRKVGTRSRRFARSAPMGVPAPACASMPSGGPPSTDIPALPTVISRRRSTERSKTTSKQHIPTPSPRLTIKQDGALKFVSFFTARTRLGIWLRNTDLTAFNLPLVGDLVKTRALRDDIELPEYEP